MGKYRPIIVTADCGSLTRAGKILGYAQPNMGSIVTRFENELGVKLFTRSKQGMTLTKTGEKLVDIMRQIDDMEEYLQEVSVRTRTERFRVGVFQSVASQWMPQVMTRFFQENPDTVFHMEHLNRNLEGEQGILENWLDCAFFRGTNYPEGMQYIPLITEPFYLLVPDNSPLSEVTTLRLEDAVGDFPFIRTDEEFDNEESYKEIRQKLMERDIIKVSASDDHTVITLVSQGLGMSLIPRLSLSGITPEHRVKAIPLQDAPTRSIGLILPKKPEDPALTTQFVALMQARVREWEQTHMVSLS